MGATQEQAMEADQHPPSLERFSSSSHDQLNPQSRAVTASGIGNLGCCKWCQRLFLNVGELEEHERSTGLSQRFEEIGMCSARGKSHKQGSPSKKDPMSKSSPHDMADNGWGEVSADWEEDLDFEAAAKDRSHLRSASVASHQLAERLAEEPLNGCMEKTESQSDSDPESENDDLGDLVGSQQSDAMGSLYGTSVPKANFLGSLSHRGRPMAPTDFWKKGLPKFLSPKTFQTAQSSLASYATAPSGSPGIWKIDAKSNSRDSSTKVDSQVAHGDLIGIVVARVLSYDISSAVGVSRKERFKLGNFIALGLSPIFSVATELNTQYKSQVVACVFDLVAQLSDYKVGDNKYFDLLDISQQITLRSDITEDIMCYLQNGTPYERLANSGEVFSSEWLDYLRNRGILLGQREELDWSGKGQHVEYSPEDERDIPLISERILGHSQTAIVDSVMCRRIRLARKKIICNRRLKKEDAITEVEHLLRLQHAHIVRIVGTYTVRKDLAILLYPAAEMDLDTYMDGVLDDYHTSAPLVAQETFSKSATRTIKTFFGCLSNAIAFIHGRNVKHMDIKPKNILVKRTKSGLHKVYIADFGIARSYTSAAESETDSPVSFTRTYAAPEVVLQDMRGFSADVFSLGCVFMEMLATLLSFSTRARDERQALLELRQNNSGTSAYYANIDVVTHWYKEIIMTELTTLKYDLLRMTDLCPRMILKSSELRPKSSELEGGIISSCAGCNAGPEPFEAAD
jgi:serine/threonine protein kinase